MMNRIILVGSVAFALCALAGAEYPELPQKIFDETEVQKAERLAWWQEARFGMFIHFGLYAMPARGEWIRGREYVSDADYRRKYFDRFDPDLFDAKEWARMAKAAGMRYVVLTAKHHDGFCLWDTRHTDFKITKTPFGRDLLREYVDALRAEGLRVGFYYSLIDWDHPDFLVDYTHPHRPPAGGTFTPESYRKINEGRDMQRYRDYMYAQVRELLTEYGKIDIIWYDFTCKCDFGKTYKDWDAVKLMKLTRSLQPGILVDNRLDLMDTDDGWDFVTPEQFKPQVRPTVRGRRVPWETCQTFAGNWGYSRDEETWKSAAQLIGLLVHSVSMDGNLILNVGPTARGEFDPRAQERLGALARWMHHHERSVRGCGSAPEGLVAPSGTELTYNKKSRRLYLHIYDYPMGRLPVSFFDRIEYAQFLHDGSEIALAAPPKRHGQDGEQIGETGALELPMKKPAVEVPVVEIWLKGEGK